MKKPISQLIADFKKDCLELGLETEIVFKSVSESNREEQLTLNGMISGAGRCETAEHLARFQYELLQQSTSLASAKLKHYDHQSDAVKYLTGNISNYDSVRIKPFIDGSVFVETFDLQLQLKYDQLIREYKSETASLRETIENQSKLINNQK